jgi:hypothetical protein
MRKEQRQFYHLFPVAGGLEVCMLTDRLSIAWKVVLSVVIMCYAGMIIAPLPTTFLWILVIAITLVVLVDLILWLDCPLHTVWPVIPGATLLLAGVLAVLQDDRGVNPVTRNSYELLSVYLIAVLLILWGIGSTWRLVRLSQRL